MAHVVELFYAEHCVGCPEALMVVRQFAAERADVDIEELDIAHHLSRARRYGLFATPAIVIDGMDVLYGVPTRAALASRLSAPSGPDSASTD